MFFKQILTAISLISLACTMLPGSIELTVKGQTERLSTSTEPRFQADSNIEFVSSHIGGTYNSVFVQNHLVYLGIGKSLVILNIIDPYHYYVEGTVRDFGGDIDQVFVDQNRAYVTDHNRLWIINVINSEKPEILGFLDSEGCTGVAAKDNLAYLTTRTAFVALDVSDPAHPNILGSLPLPTPTYWADHLKLFGNYAYYANLDDGLRIIDVSDPVHLQEAGHLVGASYGMVRDVFIREKDGNTIAYMISEMQGLLAVDVSNPAQILIQGHLFSKQWASQVFVQDNIAYVANQGGGLWVVDFSNLSTPVETGNYTINGMAFNISVEGNLALLTNSNGSLEIVDISNPSVPKGVSSYGEPAALLDVVTQDGFAYTAGSNGLGIYNVADPYNPKYTGAYLSSNDIKVQIVDHKAYLASTAGKFEIVDVQNTNDPKLIGGYSIATQDTLRTGCGDLVPRIPAVVDFALQDQYAILANSEAGLRFLDISNPAHILDLGTYKNANWVYIIGIELAGKIAYVFDGGCSGLPGALYILDLTDLAHPSILGSLPLPKMGNDLKIQGDAAYILTSFYQNTSGNGVHVIDIHDPANPQEIGFLDDPDAASIDIHGNLAYLASGTNGLRVMDISDPKHMTQVGSYHVNDPRAVYHEGCVTYLGQWGYGMTLVGYQGDGENCAISGHVDDLSGKPVAGVKITTSLGQSTTTGLDGSYALTGLWVSQYQLTPSLQASQFFPHNRQVKVATDVNSQNFVVDNFKNKVFLPGIKR